jgi:hypothetical protein
LSFGLPSWYGRPVSSKLIGRRRWSTSRTRACTVESIHTFLPSSKAASSSIWKRSTSKHRCDSYLKWTNLHPTRLYVHFCRIGLQSWEVMPNKIHRGSLVTNFSNPR